MFVSREKKKEIMVTIGDMAEALDRLRKKYGLYYNPSEREILEEAKKEVKSRNSSHS